jgi:hypothetical protein
MSYLEQLKRAHRWLERVDARASHSNEDINNPLPPEKMEEYEDYLYALFQNCWHLKDWILSDSDAPQGLKGAVERVDAERKIDALMLCADVANGSKHLSGSKPSRDARRGAEAETWKLTAEMWERVARGEIRIMPGHRGTDGIVRYRRVSVPSSARFGRTSHRRSALR